MMNINQFFKKHEEILLSLLTYLAIIVAVTLAFELWPRYNPVPSELRGQVNFKVAYPKSGLEKGSFNYQPNPGFLTFKASSGSNQLIITEQSLPAGISANSSDSTALLNHLGVHYYDQVKTKLGIASIAKFWTGDYTPAGQTGILAVKNTLVLVHPQKQLSSDDWVKLFNNMKVTK